MSDGLRLALENEMGDPMRLKADLHLLKIAYLKEKFTDREMPAIARQEIEDRQRVVDAWVRTGLISDDVSRGRIGSEEGPGTAAQSFQDHDKKVFGGIAGVPYEGFGPDPAHAEEEPGRVRRRFGAGGSFRDQSYSAQNGFEEPGGFSDLLDSLEKKLFSKRRDKPSAARTLYPDQK